ncbi:MAG: tetratricopeptide repeat protein [Saprospiraceae bacterium]|nr:tetratricopeptide repeat protein [Saprospiraceae bacterium]
MKSAAFLLMLLCSSVQIIAQSTIEDFVKEGIQFHDNGEYDKAIEMYKKALEIDPKSPLANYEIALSCFSKGDHKLAIAYSDKVLKQKSDLMLEAYIIKGSTLDILGKTKESIKLFEKAIQEVGGHYLLYFNLGLNYYNTSEIDKAEENAIKAIQLNPNHPSSHFMLANIHNQKGNVVQSLLALHYFLFIEPNSNRSPAAFQMLQNNFNGNVKVDNDKPNTINILVSPGDNSEFRPAELMISFLEASKSLEENKGKTEDEMFVQNTASFFKILGELKKEAHQEIWWTFYTPFFYDVANSEHLETYCKYITQSGNENSRKWLAEHEAELINFDTWLKNK